MALLDIPWGIVAFLVGIAYGYFARGETRKWDLFKRALLWGLVVGVVLAALAWLAGGAVVGVTFVALGVVGILVAAALLALFFILGAWIGDWLEARFRGGRTVAERRAD